MDIDEQLSYLTKGCVDVVRRDDLRRKLERSQATGVPLIVKVGFDPTAPDLHLGHTVLIRKMKHFQDLGHTVIFLIGDFTGLIGDPTWRSKTRPPLTREQIDENAETYKQQVFKLLDPVKTRVDFNSRWFGSMTSYDWVRLAARYNVAQMLERRDFKQRFEAGQPIALHEFLYSLVQAYDSVFLEADVELGGTDQLFNLNVGRDIMPSFGLEPQVVLTTPLLVGLDGVEKMSKSLGNYVGVDDPPEVIVEKLVERFTGSEDVMWTYFTLLTNLAPTEVEALKREVRKGVAPSEMRYRLARAVVTDFYGAEAAAQAEAAVRTRHAVRTGGRGLDADLVKSLPPVDVAGPPERHLLRRVLVEDLKAASSMSDATRKVQQGAVRVDGEVVKDIAFLLPPGQHLIQVGKRSLSRVNVLPEPSSPLGD